MFYGRGRGFGRGGGWGFGFRGWSPPWPYIGRGRGGLPRCGYFMSGADMAPGASPYYAGPGFYPEQEPYPYYQPQMTPENELDYLKNQADMLKSQLEQIEARVSELAKEPE